MPGAGSRVLVLGIPVLGAGAGRWCCGPGCWCCELAERAFKTGGGTGRVLAAAGVVSWQSAPVPVSADCVRCGGAVSWLCRLRTFLFQPVACQQVVGFCLAIWVYAGVFLVPAGLLVEDPQRALHHHCCATPGCWDVRRRREAQMRLAHVSLRHHEGLCLGQPQETPKSEKDGLGFFDSFF